MRQIPNSKLRSKDIPAADADWQAVWEFALTYNGYEAWGVEECAQIANHRQNGSLGELRACLFFEQRRCHHTGQEPDEAEQRYIRGVVEQIRAWVAGSRPGPVNPER